MKIWQTFLLIGIFSLSLFARWEDLKRPLNFHEKVTSIIARQDTLKDVAVCAGEDNSPPLYQVFVSGIRSLVPLEDDVGKLSRVLSLFFVTLTAIFLFLFLSSELGFLEALLGMSAVSLFYSFHSLAVFGRSTSLHLLLSTSSFIFWFWMIKKGVTTKRIILFSLMSFLNLYTHYFSLFLYPLQLIFLLILHKKEFKKILLSLPLILIGFGPWFYTHVGERLFQEEAFWIKDPSLRGLIDIFSSFWSSHIFFYSFLIIVAYSIFLEIKEKRQKDLTLLILYSGCFILLVAIKSWISTSVFLPRYFVSLYPIFLFLFLKALSQLPQKKAMISLFLLILIYQNTISLSSYYQKKGWMHRQVLDPGLGFPCHEH